MGNVCAFSVPLTFSPVASTAASLVLPLVYHTLQTMSKKALLIAFLITVLLPPPLPLSYRLIYTDVLNYIAAES